MEPKIEQPKQYTPEEIAQLERSRTISDAELLKGGAEFSINDNNKELILTPEQKEDIKWLTDNSLLEVFDFIKNELPYFNIKSDSAERLIARGKWKEVVERAGVTSTITTDTPFHCPQCMVKHMKFHLKDGDNDMFRQVLSADALSSSYYSTGWTFSPDGINEDGYKNDAFDWDEDVEKYYQKRLQEGQKIEKRY